MNQEEVESFVRLKYIIDVTQDSLSNYPSDILLGLAEKCMNYIKPIEIHNDVALELLRCIDLYKQKEINLETFKIKFKKFDRNKITPDNEYCYISVMFYHVIDRHSDAIYYCTHSAFYHNKSEFIKITKQFLFEELCIYESGRN